MKLSREIVLDAAAGPSEVANAYDCREPGVRRRADAAGRFALTHLMLTALAVLIRIVANPLSNVFQKQLAQRSAEPLITIVATHGLLTVLALAVLAGMPVAALGLDFWANMLTAVVLAVAGYVFLWYALKSTDLSVLGPINAYKAVLGLLLAVVLIGEVPNLFGLIGVALIVGRQLLRHRPCTGPGAPQRIPPVHPGAGCSAAIRGSHLLRDRVGLPQACPASVVPDHDVPHLDGALLRTRRDGRGCFCEGTL